MPFTASQLTTFYTNANIGITPSAAESVLISAYATQNANGALSDQATLQAVLALSQDKTDVALATYEFFTGASPSLAGLAYLVHGGGNANDLSSAYYANFNKENRYYNFAINLAFGGPNAASFATTWGAMTFQQAVAAAYEQIVGTANVGATAAAAAQASIMGSQAFFAAVASQRASGANQDLATKAIMIGYILEEAIKANVGTYAQSLNGFMTSLAQTNTAVTGDLLVNYPAAAAGVVFNLTTGIDTFAGGNGNDTVNAPAGGTLGAGTPTLTALDSIDGGGGVNVFNITESAGNGIGAAPASAKIVNFQTVNLTSTAGIIFDTTKITGDTQLNATAGGTVALTAATTTNVTAAATGGGAGNTVTGGANVSLTDAGGADTVSGSAGSITVVDAVQGGNNVLVKNGTNVSITTAGDNGGTITVGAIAGGVVSSAPTGSVSVTDSVAAGAASAAAGAITVNGGTAVTVTQNLSGSTADVTKTATAGAVTVNGNASTTSVTVSNTAAAAATAKVGAIVDNSVTINDVNGTDLVKAGTITSVSLSNVTGATIVDNALTSLSLSGDTGGGTITVTDSLTTPTVTSLAVALNNFKGAFTDTNNELSTISFTTTGSSTIASITDTGLKTLNVSGAAGGVTLTAAPASITSLNVTGAASFTGNISGTGVKAFAPTSTGTVTVTVDGTKQSFAGGAGTDVVTLATDAVKTIAGGSAGNNEIILNNTAATFATPANISGFQILGTQSATSGAFDLSKFAGVTAIDMQAAGGAVTFNKVTAGTSLTLSGAGGIGGNVIYSTSDTSGAADQVAVTLGSATGGTNAFGIQLSLQDSVLNGIGTVVINSVSKAPTPPAANFVNTLGTLNDSGLTALTFTGNADATITTLVDLSNTVSIANAGTGTLATITGWTDNNLKSLTLSGNVALTLNDSLATGVTVAGASDNANVSLTLAGAGAGKTDTITLGSGANTVVDTGAGTVNVTLAGATTGTDVVTIANAAAATVTVNGGANTITVNSAGVNTVNVGATGAKAESVIFGLGTNTATFGAHTGVDNVSVAAHNAASPGPAGFFLSGVITGLNSALTTNDTITFATDNAATGAVVNVTTATINAYAAATGSDPTQLATAINAVLDAANGGAGLAQHHVAVFSFQGNTYVVEQADVTGHTLANEALNSLTVVELIGTVPLTAANSSAAAGVLTLHG